MNPDGRTQVILLGIAMICWFAVVGVSVIAWQEPDSWRKRRLYLLLGGGFALVSGTLVSAALLAGHLAFWYCTIPVLLCASALGGLLGTLTVSRTMLNARKWRKRDTRPCGYSTEGCRESSQDSCEA